jgi:tRNA dimethylallyltransferase
MEKKLIVILGPTASGKTQMAAQLAYDLKGEIISADSRQVYRGMDIGTGKDLSQYVINACDINHYLIDILEPDEEFNLFEFQKRFYEVYDQILAENNLPIMVGGTGLYLESILMEYEMPPALPDSELRKELKTKSVDELREILFGLKAQQHNKTDLEDAERLIRAIEIEKARKKFSGSNKQKSEINAKVFGINWERSRLRERITVRLKQRLEEGMLDEVKKLKDSGITWSRLDNFGLEYRYIARFLQNKITYSEMFTKLNTSIHQFAKRQETWFRRMEKRGIAINWIDGGNYNSLKEQVLKLL